MILCNSRLFKIVDRRDEYFFGSDSGLVYENRIFKPDNLYDHIREKVENLYPDS